MGEYRLILESFNVLSVAKTALRTDKIMIRIVGQAYPSFLEELNSLVFTQGVDQTYRLPEIDPGDSALANVKVKPNSALYRFISYNRQRKEIKYKDGPGSHSLLGKI